MVRWEAEGRRDGGAERESKIGRGLLTDLRRHRRQRRQKRQAQKRRKLLRDAQPDPVRFFFFSDRFPPTQRSGAERPGGSGGGGGGGKWHPPPREPHPPPPPYQHKIEEINTYQLTAVNAINTNVNGLLGNKSPNGQIKINPLTYPVCANVGTRLARSSLMSKSAASLLRMGWL